MRLRERLPRLALYPSLAAAYPVVAVPTVNGGAPVPFGEPATTAGPPRRRSSAEGAFSDGLRLAKPRFTRIRPWYVGC